MEASFGLGEALVSGLVNADIYTVRDGEVVQVAVGTKQLAVVASPAGGTREQAIEPERQEEPALTDAQVVRLVQLGRRIEAHFGRPQDIEWCLVDDGFQIVQSRPITSAVPHPGGGRPREPRLRLSRPWADDDRRHEAPGALRVAADDPTAHGRSRRASVCRRDPSPCFPASRARLLEVMGKGDPLIRDALETVLDRGDVIRSLPDESPGGGRSCWRRALPGSAPIETDPAIVDELIGRNQASVATLKRDIRTRSGSALLDFILADIQELRRILFDPQSHQVFTSAMEAAWWLNEQLRRGWREERGRHAHAVRPHNVTSEMGLAL